MLSYRTLIISLLLFFSCNNWNGVGIEEITEQDPNYRLLDSLALIAIRDEAKLYTDQWIDSVVIDNWEGVTLKDGRVTSLNLYISSDSFPYSITKLSHLEKLKVKSGNSIQFIPSEISKLKNLKHLDLSYNNALSYLPSELGDLESLEELLLTETAVSNIPLEIKKLENLHTLDISYSLLKAIPPNIVEIPNLKNLILCHNRLTILPSSFGKLQSLESLDLSHNRFDSIPDQTYSLKNLEKLNINRNRLELTQNFLSERISELSQLTYLDISYSYLDSLPKSIKKLQHLKTFEVGINRLHFADIELLFSMPNVEMTLLWKYQSLDKPFIVSQDSTCLTFNMRGSQNRYEWFRNDTLLVGENSETIPLSHYKIGSTLSCVVTSDSVPDLIYGYRWPE